MNVPGTVYLDADEAANRVAIGVRDSTLVALVLERTRALGLPSDAVTVRVAPLIETRSTLYDHLSVPAGGLALHMDDASTGLGGDCTLSYIAYGDFDAVLGTTDMWYPGYLLLTNSHCKGVPAMGLPAHTTVYQWVYPDSIAKHWFDPPFQSNTSYPFCPAGQTCRYADVATFYLLAGYAPSWPASPPGFGTVYMTSRPWGDSITPGSNTIDAVNGPWHLQRAYSYTDGIWPAQGQVLTKVSRASGTTQGPVTQTCSDMPEYDNGVPTGHTLWCQYSMATVGYSGDSGSPILLQTGPNTAQPAGITWGSSQTQSGVFSTAFSSFSDIEQDLRRVGTHIHVVP